MADTATAAPAVPFEVASQYSTRPSFQSPVVNLQGAAPSLLTPFQIPAVGYLEGLLLEVTITSTGGTTPLTTADGPFNVIQSINFRNAAGVNLISPVTGYQLYLINKYGGQVLGTGEYADAKVGRFTTSGPGVAPAASGSFFLWLPLGIDAAEAYGAVPALASNANYQVEMTLAAASTVSSGAPTMTVQVNATAHYFDVPASVDEQGIAQANVPPGTPVASIWQVEQPTVSPGTALVQSYNVGNFISDHILVLRNSAGARIEANGWPNLLELYLDNQPRFSLRKSEFEFLMSRWFHLNATTKDAAGALDTGVFVLPYHALLGSESGDPANTRAQILPTLNATLLQFRAQDFGSAVSKLEIITNSISTTNSAFLYSK